MAKNNKSGGKNQPRRKRNRKPVKRYSEEYSNRPNPYTGYSADGNYHPEAKKHSADEASVITPEIVASIFNESIVETESVEKKKNEDTEPVDKSVSYRKKNIDREAEKKAQEEKREARRTAVNQISQGVAAHSVSEQVIEDIASFSDVMEHMNKPATLSETDSTGQEPVEQNAETGTENIAKEILEPTQEETVADTEKFNAVTVLDDDEPLPFDLMKAEEFKVKIAEENKNEESPEPSLETSEDKNENPDDEVIEIAPLKPEDLIPVLDFDKPPAPVLDFKVPTEIINADTSADTADEATTDESEYVTPEPNEPVTIEDILKNVEEQNIDDAEADFESESHDFEPSQDISFDTFSSEQWDGAIIPPLSFDDVDNYVDEPNNEVDTHNSLSELLDACFNESGETDEIPDEDLSDEGTEDVQTAEESFDLTENQDLSDDASSQADLCDDGLDSLFTAPDMESFDFDDFSQDDYKKVVSESDGDLTCDEDEEAEQSKLKRLVEAAELAEILKSESQVIDGSTDDEDEYEHPIVNYVAESLAEDKADDEAEMVKQYDPDKSSSSTEQSEEIFESVLIVDENTAIPEETLEQQDSSLFVRIPSVEEQPTAVFRLPENSDSIYADFEYDDADFREQWLDEDVSDDEYTSHHKKTRRRISAFIGVLVFCFAIITVSLVVKEAATGLNNIGSASQKKSEYTDFIAPVVINDPIPFDSIDAADNQMLLESAIWSVLDDEEKSKEFKNDDTGKIVLPADSVIDAGTRLFGKNVELKLNVLSESEGNVLYYYDSVDNTFHISPGSISGPSAEITKIAQTDGSISLKVGYHSDNEVLSSDSSGDDAYKYMEYVLAVNDDGTYYIESIRDYVES